MPAELAHQKADMHLYVALHRKVRIRLHPFKEPICGIHNWINLQTGNRCMIIPSILVLFNSIVQTECPCQ